MGARYQSVCWQMVVLQVILASQVMQHLIWYLLAVLVFPIQELVQLIAYLQLMVVVTSRLLFTGL